MTITEQITSQIDAVVQSISSYSSAVQAENQRTNKMKSDAAARCASQKNQIQQQADAQIQSFRDSMQTAKNAFLPNHKSYVRKAFEAYFTILIEYMWGKERIMEVYLNIVEFGDGIYGCESASQYYFEKSAKNLTAAEAAQLAATLPSPLVRNPDKATHTLKNVLILLEREQTRWN